MSVVQKLVYVVSFDNPSQARIVGNWLEQNGIECHYQDEQAVAMLWHLSGAFGGAKIFVAEDDFQKATELLEQRSAEEENIGGEWLPEAAEDLWLEDDIEDVSYQQLEENKKVDRAYLSAFFSFFFPPLILLSLWNYYQVAGSAHLLNPKAQRKLDITVFVYVMMLAICVMLAMRLIPG